MKARFRNGDIVIRKGSSKRITYYYVGVSPLNRKVAILVNRWQGVLTLPLDYIVKAPGIVKAMDKEGLL